MNSSVPSVNGIRKGSRILFSILLVILLVTADQVTKQLAVKALAPDRRIELLPGILELSYVQNRGAAFGILQNARLFFLLITAAALLVIGYILYRLPRERRFLPLHLCLCFIAAGAVGNLIDRILLVYVRDFIYFSLINFPVFNVADIYITCSTFLLFFLCVFYYKEEDFSFLNRKVGE